MTSGTGSSQAVAVYRISRAHYRSATRRSVKKALSSGQSFGDRCAPTLPLANFTRPWGVLITALATALLVSIVSASTSAQTGIGTVDIWLMDPPNDQKTTLYKKSKALVIGMDHYGRILGCGCPVRDTRHCQALRHTKSRSSFPKAASSRDSWQCTSSVTRARYRTRRAPIYAARRQPITSGFAL
jgi:hypothetical protein